jgi:hypothetical protein
MSSDRIELAHRITEFYNAQDVDSYVELMTDDACEAAYRGHMLRSGKEGVREGLRAIFRQYPQNRAEILSSFELGEFVVLYEKVWRSPDSEPFETMSVYSFAGAKVQRVEFIR